MSVLHLLSSQRLELDDEARRVRASPSRPALQQFGARHAEDEHRALRPTRRDTRSGRAEWVPPSGCRRRRAPGLRARKRFDEAPDSPESFARCRRALREPGELRDPQRNLCCIVLVAEHRADAFCRRLRHGLSHDFCERKVRRALAVRGAAADEDLSFRPKRPHQLPLQPCLADAGLADDCNDASVARSRASA